MKEVVWSILLPFAGTILGSMCVFLIKDKMSDNLKKSSSGFAAGVMVAASIWSLIIPSMNASSHLGRFAFAPSLVGIWIGFAFLLVPKEDNRAVTQVPMFCPIIMGTAAP